MSMNVKRYVAADMRTALRQVRLEQGPEAVIISSQNVPGGVEVCAAADFSAAAASVPVVNAPRRTPAVSAVPLPATGEQQALSQEVRDLRRLLERQLAALAWNDLARREPQLARAAQDLEQLGVPRELAQQLLAGVAAAALATDGAGDTAAWLVAQLRLTALPTGGGCLALVGPAGSGKSTTLAKLAVREVLQHGADSVALVSADNARLGAGEQTRALGRLLGVNTYSVATAAELAALRPTLRSKRLTLIDTAGTSARDPQLMAQRDAVLAALPEAHSLLTLPASTQVATLRASLAQHWLPHSQAVVLTRVDEAEGLGGALGVLAEHQLPLAAISDGPTIPDDLRAADGADLLRRLRRAPADAAAADEVHHAA